MPEPFLCRSCGTPHQPCFVDEDGTAHCFCPGMWTCADAGGTSEVAM